MRILIMGVFCALLFFPAAAQRRAGEESLISVEKIDTAGLRRLVRFHPDSFYIINFWATWCKPCIDELPHFLELADKQKHRRVRLILVSLDLPDDYPEKVTSFIRDRNIGVPVYWLDESNADVFCPIVWPKWEGAIPGTLFVDGLTNKKFFAEGFTSRAQLEEYMNILWSYKKVPRRSGR